MNSVHKRFSSLISVLFLVLLTSQFAYGVDSDKASSVASININTASVEELSESLAGVGPAKAGAIVAWREQFGGFQHVEELEEVKGIGPAIVAKNKSKITLK